MYAATLTPAEVTVTADATVATSTVTLAPMILGAEDNTVWDEMIPRTITATRTADGVRVVVTGPSFKDDFIVDESITYELPHLATAPRWVKTWLRTALPKR